MGRYIGSADLFGRYPASLRINSLSNVESHFIYYAENELDSRLAAFFTVPFSSNNVTVRDLAIDLTYLRIGNLKAENREEFKAEIDARIEKLISGEDRMLIEDETTLASVGGTIYSTTKDYHPAFGMGNTIDFVVDSSQMYNEEQARD